MKAALLADRSRARSLTAAAALLLVAASSWRLVVGASRMAMDAPQAASAAGAAAFVGMWGVMMAAMMLPSALPMILLYGTVGAKLRSGGERAVPQWVFAAVYLAVWLLAGIPVYALNTAALLAAARSPAFAESAPYVVGILLLLAGAYQFSPYKRSCLGKCRAPLQFLTERWKAGYLPTLRLALDHALYCVGCCAGLMAILVGAGSMNLVWVLIITAAVFAEKILPHGEAISRVTGAVLVILGAAVILNPELEQSLRSIPSRTAAPMTMR